jgi:translation initiation factor IF-3
MLEVRADHVVVIGDDGSELGVLRLDDIPSVL